MSIKKQSNEELVAKIQAGQNPATNMALLWQNNMGMVCKIVKKYRGVGELEDLEQQGYLGLHEAVQRYDCEAGASFITYAVYWIRQSIHRYLQDNGRVVRIPAHAMTVIYQYKKFCEMVEQKQNRKPSVQEIADYMKMTVQQVEQLQKDVAMTYVGSLDAVIAPEEGELTFGERIASDEDLEAETVDKVANEQLCEELWNAVDELEGRCAEVIRHQYQDELTTNEISKVIGEDTAKVKSYQNKAMNKLRRNRGLFETIQEHDRIKAEAYRNSGLTEFKHTWTSSTELSAMRLERSV